MIGPAAGPAGDPRCSAKGCRRDAAYALVWRNPRIHDADRAKTWLACEEHRDTLSDFLSLRGFPLRVMTLTELRAAGPSVP